MSKSRGEPTIREFNAFIKGHLKRSLVRAARSHEILSEGDLQAICFFHIYGWVKKRDTRRGWFRVYNTKRFWTDSRKYPDIAIFKKGKPWVLIELKEQSRLGISSANKEAEKLAVIKKHLKEKGMPVKAYVICLARKVKQFDAQIFKSCRGVPNCHFIPIVLQDEFKMTDEKQFEEWQRWEDRFTKLAKFDGPIKWQNRRKANSISDDSVLYIT